MTPQELALRANNAGRRALIRALQHLDAIEIAARIGVSVSLVSRWASGQLSPSERMRHALAQAYGIAPEAWNRPTGKARPTMSSPRRFAPPGLLALRPQAFGLELLERPRADPNAAPDGPTAEVAVVDVRGPLMHHEEWFFDSYDSIKRRVGLALASPCRVVLLRIDSPGGLVSGCFSTVRELRAMAAASRKPIYAYLDEACSAAYALACAAEKVYVAEAALVGSIGVVDCVVDQTQLDANMGVKVALVYSGARKADGNPHSKLSKETIDASQRRVDSVAALFFDLVAEVRGVAVDAVRALEANVVVGKEAVVARLADEVCTFDQLLSTAAAKASPGSANTANREVRIGDTRATKMAATSSSSSSSSLSSPARAPAPSTPQSPRPAHPEPKAPVMTEAQLKKQIAQLERDVTKLEAQQRETTRLEAAARTPRVPAARGLPPDQKRELDIKMGLVSGLEPMSCSAHKLVLGAVPAATPAATRAPAPRGTLSTAEVAELHLLGEPPRQYAQGRAAGEELSRRMGTLNTTNMITRTPTKLTLGG